MLKKSLIGTGILAALVMVSVFAPVQAASQEKSLSIPVSTIVRNKGVGSTTLLKTVQVDQDMVGMVCELKAHGENQSSVHAGNDLVIASGNDSVTLEDVERAPGVKTDANGTLTLGDALSVSLVMGEDDVFSGGMDVKVTCEEPEPTMVSANVTFNDVCDVVDDSYTVEETDGVSYNVDDQRVDGVGTVTVTATADEGYEIDGDSQWSFDFTNEPCEVPTEEVCRDGEVVTINPEDRLETDTDLPCGRGGGDVTPEAPQEVPEQLPNTGLGAVAASVAGSTSIFAGVRSWAKSRNQMKDVLSNR